MRLVFLAAPTCHHVLVWDNGPGLPGYDSKDRRANFSNLIEEWAKVPTALKRLLFFRACASAENPNHLIRLALFGNNKAKLPG